MKYNLWEVKEDVDRLLNQSTHLNFYYNESLALLKVTNKLPQDLRKNKKELLCILTNVLRAIKLGATSLQVDRAKVRNKYKSKQGIVHRKLISLQDSIEKLGYLDIYSGGVLDWEMHKVSLSFLVITPKFKELFSSADLAIIKNKELINDKPIVIRDRVTKEELNTRGVDGVVKIVEVVNKLNEALTKAKLSIKGSDLVSPQFFRSFIGDLSKGGRWYERGSKVQTKSQNERRTLMIDDTKTVEIDFKALHPALLYEMEYKENSELIDAWIDYTFKGVFDPYACPLDFLLINQEKIDFIRNNYNPKYNPVRNLCKFALMVALNANSMPSATKALVQEYKKEYNAIKNKGDTFDLSKAKYYGIEYDEVFHGSFVLSHIADFNHPIRYHLFSDAGVELQNLDSTIMSIVIDRFVSEDEEVVIPEHDSIIVKESMLELGVAYMKDAYLAVMKSDKFCYVEVK